MGKSAFHLIEEFDGTTNVGKWLREVERTSEFAKWDEEARMKIALVRLKGGASELVDHLQQEGKLKTWQDVTRALKERYQTKNQEQW